MNVGAQQRTEHDKNVQTYQNNKREGNGDMDDSRWWKRDGGIVYGWQRRQLLRFG